MVDSVSMIAPLRTKLRKKLIEVPAAWFALWALFEYGNYSCHATLRNMKLRSGGAKSAPAPDPDYVLSRAFELVSCPNYLFEVCVSLSRFRSSKHATSL